MFSTEFGGSGQPRRASGTGIGGRDLLARLNRLIDTPRPDAGHPIEWAVEAHHSGDINTIAALTLRGGSH